MKKVDERVKIFTDGACSGNPGPGGWGSILVSPLGKVLEMGGGELLTTNNRMELTAAIQALTELAKFKSLSTKKVDLYTDSTYVIRGISQWIFNWKRNDWRTAEGKAVSNKELWQDLLQVIEDQEYELEWHYVRGHEGTPGNERCDEIAVAYSKHDRPSLYAGPVKDYPVAIEVIPEDTKLPPMKSSATGNSAGKKKVVYLSYANGKLCRDADWKSCEARVKGVAGARFKKCENETEEKQTLTKWGVKA